MTAPGSGFQMKATTKPSEEKENIGPNKELKTITSKHRKRLSTCVRNFVYIRSIWGSFVQQTMASSRLQLVFFVLLHAILLLDNPVNCDDKEDKVLDGINTYRASLNLPALKENDNAGCLADEIADQLKNQPCTNSTGANTVPGTEPRFPNYPQLLSKCNLNITNTRDGVIMPVCVPNLDSSLVVSNFTKSQYSRDLNNSKYTGAGLGSEDDWMVVVLTTNTTGGDFNAAGLASKVGLIFHLLVLLLSSSMF